MRQATSLALRAVLLAAVLAALATPAVANAASVAYVDNGEVWLASLDGAKKARLATTVVNSDGDTEKWLDVAQSDGGRIVAVRNKPGRISNFSWFKIWEPERDLHRRGAAQRPERLDLVHVSARLRHHRRRVAPRLRVLELGQLLPDPVRPRDVRPAGDQQHAQSDRHHQPDASLALRLADHLARGLLLPVDRQRPGRGRRQPLHERPSPRGSTPRSSRSTSKASTSRPTGAWRHSGSRSGTAARRRSARSTSSRSRGSISRPRSPSTAPCPRPASHGTHRSRRTPRRSRGRTTAA